ncbi:MAG: hypothetical protein JOY92_06650 [Verrucomicrobia bacterium]|nr:hypothetical protein [Verrucomicrobiota bacterium]
MPARYVKPVLRLLSLVLATVAVLFALGLLAINLYLQSPGTRQKICNALSRNAGLPVSVFRISYGLWSGLVLDEVTVREPAGSASIFRASSIKARFNYLKLLQRKPVIKQLILQDVDASVPLAMLTAAEGHTTDLPPPRPSPARAGPSAPPSAAAPPGAATAAPPVATGAAPRNRFPVASSVRVQRVKLTRGTIHLLSRDGTVAGTVRDLEIFARLQRGGYSGRMLAASASLINNTLVCAELASPLVASAERIELPALQAKLWGGLLNASFQVVVNSPPYRYDLRLDVSDAKVSDIATHAGGALDQVHGVLQAKLDLHGAAGDAAFNSGEGQMEVEAGYFDQYPLLQEIGRWTQIDELQRLQFKEARSHFRVAGANLYIDEIRLLSRNCDVWLWGQIDGAQKLDLNGRLTINQFLSQKIPNELEENFVTNPDTRTRFLDFRVTGTLTHPQTDLLDRMIGDKRKLFRKLLHGDRHDR